MMAKIKNNTDRRIPGAAIYFIDMDSPGCPLYIWNIQSVDSIKQTANCLVVCQHISHPKSPQKIEIPLAKLRSNN